MSAVFGRDHELGKGGRVKKRVEKARARELSRAMIEKMAAKTPELEEAALEERFAKEIARIVVGDKYRVRFFVHVLCEKGCDPGDPGSDGREPREPAQCFSARTTCATVVRVHELAFVDPRLGPCYTVTMVRPTLWQFRVWAPFHSDADERDPDRWHKIRGLMAGADLGERIAE